MTKRKVSIRDVARKVGYSTTVVSHAMNGYAHINPQTRRQIQAVARQMGYRPNVFARSLATRHSGLIGMVVPGIITSFYPETILPLKVRLEAAGYGLLLMTSDDAKQAERRAVEFLRRRQIDGLVVAPARDVKDASLYDEMAAEGTPVVMLDRWIASARCHSVATDNSAGAEQATRHLIELGHRRIGLVKLRSTCSTTRERTAGYKRAPPAAGVAFDAGLAQSPAYNIGRDCYVDGEEVLRPVARARSAADGLVRAPRRVGRGHARRGGPVWAERPRGAFDRGLRRPGSGQAPAGSADHGRPGQGVAGPDRGRIDSAKPGRCEGGEAGRASAAGAGGTGIDGPSRPVRSHRPCKLPNDRG